MKRVNKPVSGDPNGRALSEMELKFPQLRTLLNQKVSRRQAMSTGAKAAIGVGAVVVVGAGGYLYYTSLPAATTSSTTTTTTTTSPTTTTSSHSTSSTTTTTTTSSTSSSSTGSGSQPFPITFVHW